MVVCAETILLYVRLQIGVTLYVSKFVMQLLPDYTLHGFEGCLQPIILH